MENRKTLKEAWKNLPAYKKTWIIIVAVVVAVGTISSVIYTIHISNQMSKEADRALMEAQKAMTEFQKNM